MANRVISIARQFGSGGHDIGKQLAEKLGIPFYDRNLIELASERTGLSPELLERNDERKTNQWLYAGLADSSRAMASAIPPTDITFAVQRDIILDAARDGDCVIVGRCADAILKPTDARVLSVFIAAPFESRVRRKIEIEHLDERETTALVRKTDKRRKAYYNFNTGLEWGKPENYDLTVNAATLGIQTVVDLLAALYQKL
ncbi:MAG: AAA family ATPase [Christensenellales bacterium]|jgi:cytidylate kinase